MAHSTAQQVAHTAAELFKTQGYQTTTLHHIADASHLSVSELERDYCCKERIALELFEELGQETVDRVDQIESGKLAHRYRLLMREKIAQYNDHAPMIAALFSSAMLPDSDIEPSDISSGRKSAMYQACLTLVQNSDDAPAREPEQDRMAMLFYTFHLLIVVFWLYDRTKDKQATNHLLDFVYDLFKLLRPMMVMPLVSKAMTKLSQIMMLVFGGARLVDSSGQDEA